MDTPSLHLSGPKAANGAQDSAGYVVLHPPGSDPVACVTIRNSWGAEIKVFSSEPGVLGDIEVAFAEAADDLSRAHRTGRP